MKPMQRIKAVQLAALRPPSLRTKETGDKRAATWLELFYDLVFVVAVARLGGRLISAQHDHSLSADDIFGFMGLFVVVWWTWAGFTFYADRFDTDDLGQRVLAMVQIVAVALMAAAVSSGESQSTVAFAISYIAARLVLITMYIRARYHVPETRVLITGYLRGMVAAVGIWIISVFVPEPWRFVLWGIGMAVDLVTPYIMRKAQARVPLDVTHLPERFGLFTILVLGEPVASVVSGLSESHWSASLTYTAILAVFITGSMWWLYFHNHEGTVVRRLPEQEATWKPTAWIYAHLPLAMGVVATGVGLDFVLTGHVGAAERWILAGGLSVALASLALILAVSVNPFDPRTDHKAVARLAAIPVVLIVGAIAGELAMAVIATALAGVIAIEVATDLLFEPHKTGSPEH
jgi:low temperature requirement protein LtrA